MCSLRFFDQFFRELPFSVFCGANLQKTFFFYMKSVLLCYNLWSKKPKCNIWRLHQKSIPYLLPLLKRSFPQIKKVICFSDGSPVLYKNYKSFTNLIFHENDFNFKAEWHFFSTPHIKNVCDDVGSTL